MHRRKVLGHVDKQLDIKTIIKSQAILKLLVRRTLTTTQQKLLAHQRDKLPSLQSENSTQSDEFTHVGSACDSNEPPLSLQVFLEDLRGFKPKSDLDRKLLLGLLMRDGSKTGQNSVTGPPNRDVLYRSASPGMRQLNNSRLERQTSQVEMIP